MSEVKGPAATFTAAWAAQMDKEDKAIAAAEAAADKIASPAVRKKNWYLLAAILGESEKPAAAEAAQWKARADALEQALAAGSSAWAAAAPRAQAVMLCWAAGNGRSHLLAMLLKAGADPNSTLT